MQLFSCITNMSLTETTIYTANIAGEERMITITPVVKRISGGSLYLTGVFRLSEGRFSLGDIVFDDDMKQWEYTGMGDISHPEAEKIAKFIKRYKDQA
jgi:hypothetical protein